MQVARAGVPGDWPDGQFDLVVLGELGYYLSRDELRRLVDRCRTTSGVAGTLLACHWRRCAPDMPQSAQEVHARLDRGLGLRRASHYEDDDFLLDVWTSDERSVAQREGLA